MGRRQPADPPRHRPRIRSLGWGPTFTIRESIVRTLEWFDANPYAWESAVGAGAGAGAA